MARIALAFVGAVAGFLLSGFNPIGAQIGFTLGGILGGVLFPGKLPPGPRVNDLQVTSATNGAAIPIVYGQTRLAGNVIWATAIKETQSTTSVKGGPKQTNYSYFGNFAVAFCEGPALITRIWFDSKIVYDSRNGSAPITAISESGNTVTVTSTLNPNIGDQVTIVGAPTGYNGKFQVVLSSPVNFTYTNPTSGLSSGSTGTASIPAPAYPLPTMYLGNESQNADPTIQAAVGAANCPAFRGICYAVFANFPLANFGNRVPTVRAEVTSYLNVAQQGTQSTLDAVTSTVGSGTSIQTTLTSQASGDIAIVGALGTNNAVFAFGDTPGSGWGILDGGDYYWKQLGAAGSNTIGQAWKTPQNCDTATQALLFLGCVGTPVIIQHSLGTPFTPAPGSFLLYLDSGQFAYQFASQGSFSIADNAGNTWNVPMNKYVKGVSGYAMSLIIAFAQKVSGTPTTVTATYSGGTVWGAGGQALYEISGITDVVVPTLNPPLNAIVQDVCTRCGLQTTDIDTTAITSNSSLSPIISIPSPGGYTISRPTSGQAVLKPLAQVFFFDGVESGGVLRFIPRGENTASLTIPESDLGLFKDSHKLIEQIGMAQDLPREIQVLFNDKALDYQQNKGQKRRHTKIVHTRQQTVYEMPMVIDPTTARAAAEKLLFLAYLERKPYDINLWKAVYMLFDPTDVIQFTFEGLTFTVRIVKMDIGADFSVQLSNVNENASSYLSSVVGSSGTGVTPNHGQTVPDTVLFLMDVPLLRDSDSNPSGSGYYFAMSSVAPTKWPGGLLEKSSDNVNFAQENASSIVANYGTASGTLGAPPLSPWVWDTVNTLTIIMTNGVLAGTSDLNVLNGKNALLVGSEVIQYANAVQNADGSFTISRLLRGRRGTDTFCGTHGPSESVISLSDPGVIRQQNTLANIQVLRYFRGVTYGQDISTVASQMFTNSASDLKPYAPASLAGSRDLSNNLTLTWIRRTRIGGDWLEGNGIVPLSETTESYDVEIMNGATVVRTFSALGSPTALYTATQQIADFGSTQTAVTFNVYQNSSVIGRGYKATATV